MKHRTILALVGIALLCFAAEAWSQGAGRIGRPAQGGNVPADFDTITTGITAGTTQTQAGATLCTTTICEVDTNTVSGNGLLLLQCQIAPQRVTVINATTNNVLVYGSGSDKINQITATTGYSLTGLTKKEFLCTKSGGSTWWN